MTFFFVWTDAGNPAADGTFISLHGGTIQFMEE